MAGTNPWRMLPASVQNDLAGPLSEAKRFQEEQSNFRPWFQQFYGGKPVVPKSVYPEWRFNSGTGVKTPDERNMLLCLYAKLSQQCLWGEIGGIYWFSLHAEMLFVPARAELDFRGVLKAKGYVDSWFAKGGDDTWALRSSRVGAELHFRGLKPPNPYVNAHIDLHNPGRSDDLGIGIEHYWQDKKHRDTTHSLATVQAALQRQGITVLTVP
jgi:hypothetical protein